MTEPRSRTAPVWYLDTSAALKLLVEEAESSVLAIELDEREPVLIACHLLETELRQVVPRVEHLQHEAVSELLGSVDLFDVPASLFREAGYLPGATLRSLDALHLAAAIRFGADAVVTYDLRLADAARELGIAVVAPTHV